MLRARQGRLWQEPRTKLHFTVRRGRGHSQRRHWTSSTLQTFVVGALVAICFFQGGDRLGADPELIVDGGDQGLPVPGVIGVEQI